MARPLRHPPLEGLGRFLSGLLQLPARCVPHRREHAREADRTVRRHEQRRPRLVVAAPSADAGRHPSTPTPPRTPPVAPPPPPPHPPPCAHQPNPQQP